MPTKISNPAIFARLVTIQTFTKLADTLLSASTTLPWILMSIGAPSWMISVLVPIRESGALIPQWSIKNGTSHIQNRVVLWRGGAIIQSICIAFMVPSVLFLQPLMAGLAILVLLSIMSIGRSLCSLTMKDIQGHNVTKGNRGRLTGMVATLSGLIALFSAGILWIGQQNIGDSLLVSVIGISSLLVISSLFFSKSVSAKVKIDSNGNNRFLDLFNLVRTNNDLKHLVLSRCLFLHGALVAPFFVTISMNAQQTEFTLPFFIAASAVATFISSYLWGLLSDKSAISSLLIGGFICVVSCTLFVLFSQLNSVAAVLCFFLLNVGYAGIRNGRKTYILDIADAGERTSYVASGNTIVGIALLCLGAFYALLFSIIEHHIISVMGILILAGCLHTAMLKKEK